MQSVTTNWRWRGIRVKSLLRPFAKLLIEKARLLRPFTEKVTEICDTEKLGKLLLCH
jgi:hypothetical protein